jgi:hypothetical protein
MTQEPIIPPTSGLTPEAMAALGIEDPSLNASDGTDSALGDDGISPGFQFGDISDGDIVDAEIVDDVPGISVSPSERARRGRSAPDSPRPPREAKTGPPSLDEWTNFFGRVLLRVVTDYYIAYAFRGIDEDLLSDREIERLSLSEDERQLIAVPIAEMSNKSKFMRKHGRMIVASGDAFNALVVIGAWASRVNRIAARYRPRVVKGNVNGSSGQSTPQAATTAEGATGGRFPPWFNGPIVPGSS